MSLLASVLKKNEDDLQRDDSKDWRMRALYIFYSRQEEKGKRDTIWFKKTNPWIKGLNRRLRDIECYNCHKHGHYDQDCLKKRDASRSNFNNNRGFNNKKFNDRRRGDDRRINASDDCEEGYRPQKRSRNSRYENNGVVSQSEYILFSALSCCTPPDSCDSWLVDSGAYRHFSRYKEVLLDLVERKSNLKIILGDNSTYPVKDFGCVISQFFIFYSRIFTKFIGEVLGIP